MRKDIMKAIFNCKRAFGKPGNKRTVWLDQDSRDLADYYMLEHIPAAYGCKNHKKIGWDDVMWIVDNLWEDHFQYGMEPPLTNPRLIVSSKIINAHIRSPASLINGEIRWAD